MRTDIRKSEEEYIDFTWGLGNLEGDLGFVRVYGFMLRSYSQLGVTRQEMLLLIHLASYRYNTSSAESRPSTSQLAREMGYSHRKRITELLRSLEEKGLLRIVRRKGRPSLYDASPFAQRCLKRFLSFCEEETRECEKEDTYLSEKPPMGARAPTCLGARAPTCLGARAPTYLGARAPTYLSEKPPMGARAPTCLGARAPTYLGARAPTNNMNTRIRRKEDEDSPTPEPDTYLPSAEVQMGLLSSGSKPSWTVPKEAGGANRLGEELLSIFCRALSIELETMPEKKRRQWALKLSSIAEEWSAQPDEAISALRALFSETSDFAWKSYSSPFQEGFKSDFGLYLARAKSFTLEQNLYGRRSYGGPTDFD